MIALLGDLVEITGGGTPSRKVAKYWAGDIPWATVKDFKSLELNTTQERISSEGLTNSASNMIPAGSIIVPTRMAVGKAAINTVDMAINQDLKALRIKNPKKVNRDYLFRLILNQSDYLERRGKGATVKGITLDVLREMKIPLPPLEEQKRIAAILDKADDIRRKRQQAIALTDQLLRSVFLDMFGDPVTNNRKWKLEILEKFCSKIVDCPHSTPKYAGKITPYPCIRSSDLQDGHLVFGSTKYLEKKEYTKRIARLTPEPGDIIYCREGARLGNLAIIPDGVTPCLGQRIMLMRVDSSYATSEYLLFLLNSNSFKNKLIESVIGAAAPRINLKDLIRKKLPFPPIEIQQKFSRIRKQILNTRNENLAFVEVDMHLSNSLTQHAFLGELSQQSGAA